MALPVRLSLCCFLLAASFTSVAAEPSVPDDIRVRLFERAAPQTLLVSAEHGVRFYAGTDLDHVLMELGPHEEATIRMRGKDVYVQMREHALFALSLQLVPRDQALLHVEVTEGRNAPVRRDYAGRLHLEVDLADAPSLKVVNQVSLIDYVACVVAREYGFDDMEGAKAMAVLARTYALRAAGTFGDDYDLVDHQLAQQYDGFSTITGAARKAAVATRGEVLTYRDELVEAVYFSSSGGHTADNDAVWNGTPVPYLRGVNDPYDAASPHARWNTSVPRDRLLRALSERYGVAVEGFYVGEHSRDGRVQTIELIHQNRTTAVIPSNEFRLFVNGLFGKTHLKSTLFDVTRNGDQYVFAGRGFGHGVGLSQYGALEMSRRGFAYREILSFYFKGVQVQQWAGAPNRPALAENPPPTPTVATTATPVSIPASVTTPTPITTAAPPSAKEKKHADKKTSTRRVGW